MFWNGKWKGRMRGQKDESRGHEKRNNLSLGTPCFQKKTQVKSLFRCLSKIYQTKYNYIILSSLRTRRTIRKYPPPPPYITFWKRIDTFCNEKLHQINSIHFNGIMEKSVAILKRVRSSWKPNRYQRKARFFMVVSSIYIMGNEQIKAKSPQYRSPLL